MTKTKATFPKYITASERIKCIGTIDARFPDFGHHLEKEMGGLWLHPIKLLDGFWAKLKNDPLVDVWLIADEYEALPWGNRFEYGSNLGHTPIRITQEQYCPEEATGLIVSYELYNRSDKPVNTEFTFLARTDLRPVWFSERAGIVKEGYDEHDGDFVFKVKNHPWYVAVSGETSPEKYEIGQQAGPENTHGEGQSISLHYSIQLEGQERKILRFFIAGSYFSKEDCQAQLKNLATCSIETKINRYKKIADFTKLTTSDKPFNQVFEWVKYHTDWLTMDCGKYGRGLAAGMPEYPWWFGCDNSYALQGVLAMGDFTLVRGTLELLLKYSEKYNGNGQILHEITTLGVDAHPGNTQEAAHFIVMLWHYYEWTGDITLVERAFPYMQKSVEWLKSQDKEGDGFPGGYGIIEIQGLNSKLLDTAVYTALAYEYYASFCDILEHEAGDYFERASTLKKKINTHMWDEAKGLYCDVFDGKKGRLIQYNWIINTPMETGIADNDKAHRALANMYTPQFIGSYGMYLSGKARTSMMTISTGVMATAFARYGYVDWAYELLGKITATFGRISPGCIAEMSPDYGCFVQGWTAHAVMVPVVKYFFGIQPKYENSNHKVVISPQPPGAWDEAAIERVRVLDGEISLSFMTKNGKRTYTGHNTVTYPVVWHITKGKIVTINDNEHNAIEDMYINLPRRDFIVVEM